MNYRFLIPMFCVSALEQTTFSLLRITTSYRAIELDLSAIWLGAIAAAYSVLPLVIALRAGRYVDRGHDARTGWVGGALLVVASAGMAMSYSMPALFLCSAILGVSQLLIAISSQTQIARNAP